MKLLREYIRELMKEEGVLGKYAWPSANKSYRDWVTEPDTDIETKLYHQLSKHFGTSSYLIKKGQPPLDSESIAALTQILMNGDYPNTFQRCGSGKAMRGMKVSLAWLKRNAPEAMESLPSDTPEGWTSSFGWNDPVPVSFTFSSKGKYGGVSSWTNNFKIASSFTKNLNNKNNKIEIILHADCSSGLFMHTQAFSTYRGPNDYDGKKLNPQGKGEREIVLIGDCQVNAIQLFGTKETWAKYKHISLDPSMDWMTK